MYLYGRGSPRRGSRKVSVGRSSPRRGSRKRDLRLTEHTKTHNTKTRCRDIPGKQYAVKVVPLDQIQCKYEAPKILRSIFSTDSCLQSDNGVSTSNSPPARNIVTIYPVMIYPDYYLYIEICIPKYQNTSLQSFSLHKSGKQKCCICKNTRTHSLILQTHP